MDGTVVWWLPLSPHNKRVLSSNPLANWNLFFAYFPCGLYLVLFLQSRDTRVRLTCNSKLVKLVVHVNGSLSLF